jgi:hypothetical protein
MYVVQGFLLLANGQFRETFLFQEARMIRILPIDIPANERASRWQIELSDERMITAKYIERQNGSV